ncbi:hypothetical protein NE237_027831 [Protea cynaroides]|uniref:RING-type E3 ubiquitin transferase n=1 Tax=Protea cynaroides TaxID=273540 RepID=A0A9Q0GP99_9MAGN|nr:hypothetical protein NE237_027831 [Protea cynaroides]
MSSGSSSSSDTSGNFGYNTSGNWVGVVLTLIISIVIAVTLVLILYISAWCLLKRSTARRRSRINQLISEATIMRTHGHEPAMAGGVDPCVIASLPVFTYKELKQQDEKNVSRECAVCLGLFQDEEMIWLLPNCKHFFHSDCINRWLISNTTCPICRCTVESRVPPELHEMGSEILPSLDPPVLSDSENV